MTSSVRRLTLIGAASAISVAAGSACRSESPLPAPTLTPFEAFADSLRAAHTLPALALAVVRADSTVGLAAVGLRRVDRPDEVTIDDSWHLASVTKGVTASMIGVLVDRGSIGWTTTLAEVFPEMRASMDARYRSVTLSQLLAHTGGVQPYNTYDEIRSVAGLRGTPVDQRLQLVRSIVHQPPRYEPGSRHQYSNAGYTVAAAMAERAAGKPWETLVEEDLLQPIGARVLRRPAGAAAEQSGHVRIGAKIERREPAASSPVWAPPGGVALSIGGYAAFMRAHLSGLAGRDGVLKASTVRALHTPAAPLPANDTTGATALGWGVRMTEWGRIDGHAGSSGTAFCKVELLVDQDLGLALCTNVSGDGVGASADSILESLRHRYASRPGRTTRDSGR